MTRERRKEEYRKRRQVYGKRRKKYGKSPRRNMGGGGKEVAERGRVQGKTE